MSIIEEVQKIVADILEMDIAQLNINSEMEDVEGWDSMRNVMILSTLEEHFDVLFPSEDILDLVSVKALAQEIEKLKN